MTEVVEIEPLKVQYFSFLAVQTGSWAHLASYPKGTEGSFTRGKPVVA
jgi:hypothetical protein